MNADDFKEKAKGFVSTTKKKLNSAKFNSKKVMGK